MKDDQELGLIRKACEITGKLYSKHLKDQIINIVDSERVKDEREIIRHFFIRSKLSFFVEESKTFEIIRRSRISAERRKIRF